MTKNFRDALIEQMRNNKVSAQRLADATGVSKHQIDKIRQRETASTNVDDAIKIAGFFNMTLDEFLNDPTIKQDVEIVSLLHQLEPHERDFLLNAAKAQIDARNQSQKQSDEASE